MLKKPPNFEKEYIKSLRKNDLDVIFLLNKKDKGILKKIKNFCNKHGFPFEATKNKIKKDIYFRALFSKDPVRQKLHENIAAKFIRSLPRVKNFKQLNHGELSISNGMIISRKNMIAKGGKSGAKTIDFKWQTRNKDVFASHKYTKESGGAQDNQYTDLQKFIREANESNLPNTLFLAIADGKYYETNDSVAGVKKIDYLKKLANRQTVFALSIDELEKWLDELK